MENKWTKITPETIIPDGHNWITEKLSNGNYCVSQYPFFNNQWFGDDRESRYPICKEFLAYMPVIEPEPFLER
jgi:hypothetical protein